MSTAFKQRKPAKATQTVWVERWSPPKPLAGVQTLEKVLNRHSAMDCPESRLVVTVIAHAIRDSLSVSNRRMRREARRFVLGEDLTPWCDLVGLNPDFVRFVAKKAGYLADEKAHWQRVPIKVAVTPASAKPVVSARSAPVHSIACHTQPIRPLED